MKKNSLIIKSVDADKNYISVTKGYKKYIENERITKGSHNEIQKSRKQDKNGNRKNMK